MLKNKQEIEDWLKEMKIKNFEVNDDLTVDVDGYVNISKKKLTEIPVQFNKIKGEFDCGGNEDLKSLKGCPQIGITDFECYGCDLRDLEGAPKEINGWFDCSDNKDLKSPKYAPKSKKYLWPKLIPEPESKLYEELINETDYDETQEIWDDFAGIFAIQE